MSHKDNFIFLTVALIFLLFSSALLDQFAGRFGQYLIQAATIMTLAVSVLSIRANRPWYRSGIGFTAAIALVTLLGAFLEAIGLDIVQLFIMLGFFLLTIWRAGQQILLTGNVDRNKLLGAVSIYLLLGLIWAVLYLLLLEVMPDAFNGVTYMPWYDNFNNLIYFSFVALSTLGFGEITPQAPLARFLVYLEVIVGQFYLAILVASLVGISISSRGQEKK